MGWLTNRNGWLSVVSEDGLENCLVGDTGEVDAPLYGFGVAVELPRTAGEPGEEGRARLLDGNVRPEVMIFSALLNARCSVRMSEWSDASMTRRNDVKLS